MIKRNIDTSPFRGSRVCCTDALTRLDVKLTGAMDKIAASWPNLVGKSAEKWVLAGRPIANQIRRHGFCAIRVFARRSEGSPGALLGEAAPRQRFNSFRRGFAHRLLLRF